MVKITFTQSISKYLKIYGDPTEKNQYFTLTDRNTGYPISQRDLLSKNANSTITNSNTFSSPRYIDPQKMSGHSPIDDDPNFNAGISVEGLKRIKSIEAGVHLKSRNLTINASGGGAHNSHNMAVDANFKTANGSSIGANFKNDNNEKEAGLNYSHLFGNGITLGLHLNKDFEKSNRNKVDTNVKIPF